MTARSDRLLARVPELGLNVLVVGSALAIGAVHSVSALVAAALASTFAVLAFLESARARRPVRLPLLVWAAALAGLYCLVQTLPLGGLVDATSPDVARLWSLADVGSAHLSGNLAGTRAAATRYLLYALLLAGASVWYRSVDRVQTLVDLVITSASVVAVVGLVQAWLKADSILFVYEPRMGPVRAGVHGTFVNPDHFGAYAAAGALLAMSRGALLQVQRRRFLDYALGTLLLTACFLSLSLSALVGLAVGLLWLTVVWRRRNRKLGDLLGVVVGIAILAGFIAVVAVTMRLLPNPVGGLEAQLDGWAQQATIWRETGQVALGAPFVGIGGGTLPDLLASRLEAPAVSVWFTRNQPLQSVVDIGLPLGLLLVVAAAALLRRTVTRWPLDHLGTVMPVVVAVIGLAVIGLCDFAWAIPAVGVVGCLLCGALFAQACRLGASGRRLPHLSSRAGVLVAVALAVSTIGAAAWAFATDRASQAALARIEALAVGDDEAGQDDVTALESAAREQLALRPGEGRLYATVGLALLRHGATELARDWLRTAVLLRPNDATSQELLALAAIRAGERDAALERLEAALAVEPGRLREILALVVDESEDVDLWLALTPDAPRQGALVTELLGSNRAVDALRYAGALLETDPNSAAGFDAGARAAFELGLDDLAEYYARNLARVEPDSAGARVVQARVELRRGEVEEARAHIEAVLAEHPDDYAAWYALGETLLLRVQSDPDADEAIEQMRQVRDRLRPIALSDPERRLDFYRLSAHFYLAARQWRAAASAAQHGLETGPGHADLHEIRGLAFYELGDYAAAAESLRRAIELGSTNPRTLSAWARLSQGDPAEEPGDL